MLPISVRLALDLLCPSSGMQVSEIYHLGCAWVVTGSLMPGMTFYNELMLKVMYGGDQMNE